MKTAVYVITNLVSNKVYVGSSVNAKRRLKEHRNRLNRKQHGNEYLQRAWDKYGPASFKFEIVEQCDPETRLVREQEWINNLKAENEDFGYNLIPTRSSQFYGEKLAKFQKAGWAKLSKLERSKLNAHLKSSENKAKALATLRIVRSKPEYKAKRKAIAYLGVATPENAQRNRERQLQRWKDPAYRAARIDGLNRGREKTNAARRAKSNQPVMI